MDVCNNKSVCRKYDKSVYRSVGASFLCAAVLLSLLINSREVAAAVGIALTRSCRTVIPALFPAMCICGAFIKCGGVSRVGSYLDTISQKFFGIGGEETSALFCGFICGYPVGAQCVGKLSETKTHPGDCTRLVCAAASASPAFVFGVVGASWGSGFALTLYLTVIISSLVYLVCTKPSVSVMPSRKTKVIPLAEAIVSSVKESAVNCLYIVGFIVFFSVLCELLTPVTNFAGRYFTAFFAAFFEFSRAVDLSAAVDSVIIGAAVTGFAVAFGGASVIAQTVCVIPSKNFSPGRYILFKLVQGTVAAVSCCVHVKLFPKTNAANVISVSVEAGGLVPVATAAAASVVLFAAGCYFMKLSK